VHQIFTPFAVEQVARLLKAACGRQDARLQRLVSDFIRDVAATDAGLFGSASSSKAVKTLSECVFRLLFPPRLVPQHSTDGDMTSGTGKIKRNRESGNEQSCAYWQLWTPTWTPYSSA
jgi:hypothetical protein